jgi:type IV pilus assembly protein PilY1
MEAHDRTLFLHRAGWLALAMGIGFSAPLHAQLNLSDNALEAVPPVDPNIFILSDDSGSMDWEVITTHADEEFQFTADQPDGSSAAGAGSVKHRDSDDDGTANCTFTDASYDGYIYGVEFGSNQYGDGSDDCNTADDEAWRFRNSDFNRVYFNPNNTYEPWAGVDSDGDAFDDIDAENAPNNPYNPTETINLLEDNSNWDGAGNPRLQSDRDGDGNNDGFRFYTWNDDDSDDYFDNGEETEYQIGNMGSSELSTLNTYLTDRYGADAKQYADVDEVQENFANWFGYYRSRELAAKAALSRVVRDATSARIGYGAINGSVSGREVASMNVSASSGEKRGLLDQLYSTDSSGSTPLRQNLRNVGRYFACEDNSFFGDTGDYDCPIQTAAEGGACQQNYAILMTDGFYNGGDPGFDNEDSDSGDFSGGAFADSYEETLADVAMYFYKTDLSGHPDQVPTTSRDRLLYIGAGDLGDTMHQHMGTYTIGFGVDGTLSDMPSDPDTAFTWPDPTASRQNRIDDLRHAAYNGRGQFLSAGNPQELADALGDVFEEIQQGVGTGSAVAFNTQNIRTDSVVFRAFYDTQTNTGDLVAQAIESDGTIDTSTNLWSAAEELDAQTGESSDSRTIITYDRSNTSGIPFRWGDLTTDQQDALHLPTRASVTDPDRTDNGGIGDERLEWVRGRSEHEGNDRTAGDMRDRPVVEGKLGDITHSSPVFVGAPQFSGRNGGQWPAVSPDTYAEFKENELDRTPVVYVGANDGMLHAFRTEAGGGMDAGSELFAYVPEFLQEDLPDLADPEYNHRFYVDASPAINDFFSQTADAWRTVLIGGAGAGGRGYFALDITDPGNFSDESTASSQVLWEFTNDDDDDLGFTFSEPVIAMSNAEAGDGSNRWVAIFGNGYNSTAADGDAKLFIAIIDEGRDGTWTVNSDYFKLNTGFGMDEYDSTTMPHLSATTPNGIGEVRVIDVDGNGTADYVYAGDLQGHLMRFDLTSSNTSHWSYDGVLFQATYSDNTVQPITQAPIVMDHPDPGESGHVVITGTGSWMTTDDRTSEEIQSLYGIWDDMGNLNTAVERDDLVEQTFTNEVDPVHGFVVRTSTDAPINWSNTGGSQERGWYIDLDMPPAGGSAGDPAEFPGERAVRNLQLRGGILFVNTIIPKAANPCESGPGGFELGLDPANGGRPDKVVFGMNNDGVFNQDDSVAGSSDNADVVTGRRLEGGVPTDAGFIGNIRVTQVGADVEPVGTNTEDTGPTGRHSWREIINN